MKLEEQRHYQKIIIEKTVKSIKEQLINYGGDFASVQISSPTGSGKTYMGLKVVKSIIDDLSMGDQTTVCWVALRRVLLEQAKRENEIFTNIKNFRAISMFDSNPPKSDILIFDESHHSAANSAINVLSIVKPKIYIGLSATPFRTDNIKLNFKKIITEANYRTLIRDGYLSDFNIYIMKSKYNQETVAHMYANNKDIFKKSIIFFHTKRECDECHSILMNNYSIDSSVVTSDSNVDKEIQDFIDGKTQVLLNVNILTEGFDCAELNTVFVRDASKLPTIQMCGRVLRKYPGKIANIVQSENTSCPFDKYAEPKSKYIFDNGVWKDIGNRNGVLVQSMEKNYIVMKNNMNFITRHKYFANKDKKKQSKIKINSTQE